MSHSGQKSHFTPRNRVYGILRVKTYISDLEIAKVAIFDPFSVPPRLRTKFLTPKNCAKMSLASIPRKDAVKLA